MGAPDLSSWIWPDADQKRQPQSNYQIDRSNPITAGLQAVINPLDRKYTTFGTVTTGLNSSGQAIVSTNANSNNAQAVTSAAGTGGSFTVLWVGQFTSNNPGLAYLGPAGTTNAGYTPTGGAYLWYSNGAYSVANNVIDFGYYDSSGTSHENTWSFAQPAGVVSICAALNNTVSQTLAVNGVLLSTQAATTARGVNSAVNALIAGPIDAGVITGGTNVNLVAFWNRALTPAEIASVSANPWQIFQPARLGIAMPASGGSTTNLPTISAFDATAGSLSLGGSGSISSTGLDAVTGNAIVGGTVNLPSIAGLDATTGSTFVGGSLGLAAITALDATTAVVGVGGTMPVSVASNDATTGAASLSGSGPVSVSAFDATRGNTTTSGTVAVSATALDATTGNAQLGQAGVAQLQVSAFDAVSGSSAVSGAGAVQSSAFDAVTASVNVGGSSPVSASGFNAVTGNASVQALAAGSIQVSAFVATTGFVSTGGKAAITVTALDGVAGNVAVSGSGAVTATANDATFGSSLVGGSASLSAAAFNAEKSNFAITGQAATPGQIAVSAFNVSFSSPVVSIFTLPDSTRTYTVQAESRSFVVSSESRTLTVQPETRVYKVA